MTEPHTPGPWTFEDRVGNDPRRMDHNKDWGKRGLWGADGSLILGDEAGWDGGFDAPSDANARLIAAAPDMLAALRYADEMTCIHTGSIPRIMGCGTCRVCKMKDIATAAIAKATGA